MTRPLALGWDGMEIRPRQSYPKTDSRKFSADRWQSSLPSHQNAPTARQDTIRGSSSRLLVRPLRKSRHGLLSDHVAATLSAGLADVRTAKAHFFFPVCNPLVFPLPKTLRRVIDSRPFRPLAVTVDALSFACDNAEESRTPSECRDVPFCNLIGKHHIWWFVHVKVSIRFGPNTLPTALGGLSPIWFYGLCPAPVYWWNIYFPAQKHSKTLCAGQIAKLALHR